MRAGDRGNSRREDPSGLSCTMISHPLAAGLVCLGFVSLGGDLQVDTSQWSSSGGLWAGRARW